MFASRNAKVLNDTSDKCLPFVIAWIFGNKNAFILDLCTRFTAYLAIPVYTASIEDYAMSSRPVFSLLMRHKDDPNVITHQWRYAYISCIGNFPIPLRSFGISRSCLTPETNLLSNTLHDRQLNLKSMH